MKQLDFMIKLLIKTIETDLILRKKKWVTYCQWMLIKKMFAEQKTLHGFHSMNQEQWKYKQKRYIINIYMKCSFTKLTHQSIRTGNEYPWVNCLLRKKEVETNKYNKRYPLIATDSYLQFADKYLQNPICTSKDQPRKPMSCFAIFYSWK